MTKRPYSRVYWDAVDDDKFATIWDHDARLATWLRLLVGADMAWPASATLYYGIDQKSLAALVDARLVDLQTKGRYRIHGLDKERNARSESGRDSANIRWHGSPEGMQAYSNGNATAVRPHYEPNASQDEPSKDETRRANARGNANDDDARARASARHLAYQRGEITEQELAEMRAADIIPLKKVVQ